MALLLETKTLDMRIERPWCVLALIMGVTACQPGYEVGVRNSCSTPVEVSVESREPGPESTPAWVRIDAGARRAARAVPIVEEVYVSVRRDSDSAVRTFEMPLSLPSDATAADYEREVQLEGAHCPV